MSVSWEIREEADYLASHAEWMRGLAEQRSLEEAESRRDRRWAGLVLLISVCLVALFFWRAV